MTFLTWLRKTTAGKSADSMADRALTQFPFTISFEQRFNCLICWAPNLRMIYGSCQHRLCENCLYDKLGNRKVGLERCPTCQRENTFPLTKPDIPEDNVEIQAHLGVRKCPNGRCNLQMWHWEIPDHLEWVSLLFNFRDCMSTRQIIRFAIFHIMSRARVSVKFYFRSEKLSFNLFDDQFDDWML